MPAPQSQNSYHDADYIRIKREPLHIWLGRLIWVILLVLLLEYAIKSHQEREPQATITASALAVFLLVAGVIVEVVRHVESQGDEAMRHGVEVNHDWDDRGDDQPDDLADLTDPLRAESSLNRPPIITVPMRDKEAFDE